MASIVYDAALAAKESPFQRISYSRRKDFYSQAGRYFGTEYGYSTVVHSVDALVAAGVLVEHDRRPPRSKGDGIQSSYLPAPFLANLDLPEADCKVGELMRLKNADGKLVSYRETDRIARERAFLEKFNRHIAEADIHLNAGKRDGRMIRFPGHAVYPDFNELYRVFNGGWNLGGRFYGGWWQQVRSCDRKEFLIDGLPTCELDFEMLHPRLIYAMSGHALNGDAYTIDGWNRKVCKRAFNILLNANTYRSAIGAIKAHVGDDEAVAKRLVSAIKRKHKPIKSYIHSGAGLRLQNVDAEIARNVLRELTLKNGITALPIHDSFIVRHDQREQLVEAMNKAYSDVTRSAGIMTSTSTGYQRTDPHMVGTDPVTDGGVSTKPTGDGVSDGLVPVPPYLSGPTDQPQLHRNRLVGSGTGSVVDNDIGSGSEVLTSASTDAVSDEKRTCSKLAPITRPVKRPHRRVPMPAFLCPEKRREVQQQKLTRLAEQPLKAGRTMDQIPTVRKFSKGKTRAT